MILETEGGIESLLSQCTHDYSSGSYYYRISSRRHHYKEVQVIPWLLGDSNFVLCSSQRLDPEKTVFVGALHGERIFIRFSPIFLKAPFTLLF